MNMKMPCKGRRENDLESMTILIEALTIPSFVILDAYPSTYPQNVQCFCLWIFVCCVK